MLLQYCALGTTLSWDDGFLGARASRPHKAWHGLGHLLHLDRPGTASWLLPPQGAQCHQEFLNMDKQDIQDSEPFAKFARKRDLLSGRVVVPGSAGVPPAQDLAGSWRLASQGWSVHLPTGAGAAPLQECGRDARAPRGKPMAGQVQIRILQKALERKILSILSIDVNQASTHA